MIHYISFIIINYKYFLLRKYEGLISIIEKKTNIITKIKKNLGAYLLLELLLFIFNNAIFVSITFFLIKEYDVYINSILLIYYLSFLTSYVFKVFYIAPKIMQPVNHNILFLSPLNNKYILLLLWCTHLFINEFKSILTWAILLFLLSSQLTNILFALGITILIVLSALCLNFILLNYIAYVNFKNVVNGFFWNSFFFNFAKSIIFLILSLIVSFSIFSILDVLKAIILQKNWKNIISDYILLILDNLNLYVKDINYFYIFLLVTTSFLIMASLFIHKYLSGVWYRTEWIYSNRRKDWFDFLKYNFTRINFPLTLKYQLTKFFNSREQLRIHYGYFYIHPLNFISIGFAIAYSYNHFSNNIINLLIIFVIINSFSKDCFSQVELFPGLLRFDSDKNIMTLYKLTDTPFSKLYKDKINIQRILGSPECLLLFLTYIFILKPDIYLFLFMLTLTIYNFLVTPHLNTISSFIFPHFNYQHFSEFEEYIEDSLFLDKIGFQFKQFTTLAFLVPSLFLLYLDYSLDIVYLVASIIYLISTFVSLKIIKYIILKKESNYQKEAELYQ